jgi:hypothetical protein
MDDYAADETRKQYQSAMIKFCMEQRPEYFVTLTFNSATPVHVDHGHKSLHHFRNMLDRSLVGRHSYKFDRTNYIAFPEGNRVSAHADAIWGLHYHLILTPPSSKKVTIKSDTLRSTAERLWQKCAPSGTVHVARIDHEDALKRISSYVCKRLNAPNSLGRESFVVETKSSR